jgi:hypothetical protein
MCATDGIVLVDYVSAEILKAVSQLFLSLGRTARNADVAREVSKVIADHRAVSPRKVDDLHECSDGLLLGRPRVRGDPMVHFCDVLGRNVGVEKLRPVLTPSSRHELGLSFHGSSSARDVKGRGRKFPLHRRDQRIDVGGARSARNTRSRSTRMDIVSRRVGAVRRMARRMMADWTNWFRLSVPHDGSPPVVRPRLVVRWGLSSARRPVRTGRCSGPSPRSRPPEPCSPAAGAPC